MMKKITVLLVAFLFLFSTVAATAKPAAINRSFLKGTGKPAWLVKEVVSEPEIIPAPEPEVIVAPEPEVIVAPVPAITGQEINVQAYGAKGDGIADDTAAIQKAIDEAGMKKLPLLIPASDRYYRITRTLALRDNLHIIGHGATLFMPSQASPANMLASGSRYYISNVTIEGLSLKSTNDRAGSGYWANSLTSHVQGIYIQGIDTLTINNMRMDNMYVGLKLGGSQNGLSNKNIQVDSLEVYHSRTPLLMGTTDGFSMTNSILDASGGATAYLHAAYIAGSNRNLSFNNVQFKNSPGGGIHIYQEGSTAAENVTIENCSIENTRVGVYIYSGAQNITISNVSIKRTGLAFAINNASSVKISKVNISDHYAAPDTPVGAFSIRRLYQSQLSDITIDAKGMGSHLFTMADDVVDVTFSNLSVKNIHNTFFYTASTGIRNLLVENSQFEWMNASNTRISFRGDGAQATFRNNTFKNHGEQVQFLADNYANTKIVLERNLYGGFTSLTSSRDYSTDIDNTKLVL